MDSILNSNSAIANKKSGRRSGISSLFVKLSAYLTGRMLINSAIRTRKIARTGYGLIRRMEGRGAEHQ